MNYLVLLRHGQSQWNLENRFTGFVDVDLTDLGRQEAKEAGQRLKHADFDIDVVFTSTQKRAIETTDIVLKECGLTAKFDGKIIRHDDLRERGYGDLQGLNKAETAEKYGKEQVRIWRRSYDTPPPGGESLQMVVEKRTGPYFEKNIRPLINEGKNILIGAHGNSIRAMLITLGVETPDTINDAEIPTGVPLVFEFDHGKILKRYFLES
ncbi:MAG: 2,3-bisphosphoglycerate-dependent phosphoglycerate mutase [Micavibrio sp.]|nr:2,3-bisphosphoglycerate-dependent phosphoglycerate mutase [Micavibrio sp.]|tara:strand:+ start:667 stop:1293 length:627 start_codon:yes stop_codon:yes gene_type:complete